MYGNNVIDIEYPITRDEVEDGERVARPSAGFDRSCAEQGREIEIAIVLRDDLVTARGDRQYTYQAC